MIGPGGYAVIILAIGWILLVAFLAYVLVKLGGVLQSTEELVDGITEKTIPLLGEVTASVVHVNAELERVDAITENVQTMSSNVAGLTTLFGATLGSPLVKVAAFSYGVRRAASRRAKSDVEARIKDELKAERATRKGRR
ncbi:MAG TPA: DUF948 domain-containing protein [Mycobacteriales bacterium]|jgi:uncharacterized protein YoxC|nr:DUF948 domain-containing protein [Mycobacteriales bacterium]